MKRIREESKGNDGKNIYNGSKEHNKKLFVYSMFLKTDIYTITRKHFRNVDVCIALNGIPRTIDLTQYSFSYIIWIIVGNRNFRYTFTNIGRSYLFVFSYFNNILLPMQSETI